VTVPNGEYSMTGDGQWIEKNADGQTMQFTEAGRNASSISLTETSTGATHILDLGQRKVLLAEGNAAPRPILPILSAK
jgi:hypothetical protein